MTPQGYENRKAAIEWHADWWRSNGVSRDLCKRMMQHCIECANCDFYGEERPKSYDYWENRMEAYFDRLFRSRGSVVSYD